MADKDKPKDVMREPYISTSGGKKIRATVAYSQLTSSLKGRIGADLTEHELLEMIIIQAKMINLHLMSITGEEIEWP